MRPLSLTRPLMHGPEVALWQRFLTSTGLYSGPINGTFDDRTSAATVDYQERLHIETNGLVGPATPRPRRKGEAHMPAPNNHIPYSVGDLKEDAANRREDVSVVQGLLNVQIIKDNRSDRLLRSPAAWTATRSRR